MTNAQLKNSIWRVPLICLIAGLLYIRCYVWIVLRFGVLAPGEINDTVGLLTDAGLLAAFMALGWLIFLQRQTRREVFISSSVVVVYGILLWALQLLTGSTTGPAAVIFMRLNTPLEWMEFPVALQLYLQNHLSISIPFLWFLRFFIPWLFVLFAEKDKQKTA